MARVRSIQNGHQSVKAHPSEVDCFWQAVTSADGTKYLHLSSFGSDQRQSEPKSSQSLQFDREQAAALLNAIKNTFPRIEQSV